MKRSFAEQVQARDDFEDAIRTLVGAAHENDVDVEGGWELRSDGSQPDVEILITELKKPTASEPK